MDVRTVSRWCAWVAVVLLLVSIITGYGITEFRTVTSLSFGVLDKAVSQKLHLYLDIPLIVFLVAHIGTALWARLCRR